MNDYINVITMLLKAGTDYESRTMYDEGEVYISTYDSNTDSLIVFVFTLDGKFIKIYNDTI